VAVEKTRKPSEPEKVDAWIKAMKHPLSAVVVALRRAILEADPSVGEEIKWNAPTFFFTGELGEYDPREYTRVLVVFNLYRKDCIRLVFWRAAAVKAPGGFLEGDYEDGRRLASFSSLRDVTTRKATLQKVLKQLVKSVRGAAS
jgi:hypothetical protein